MTLVLANPYLSFQADLHDLLQEPFMYELHPQTHKISKIDLLHTSHNIHSDDLGRVFCENTSIYFQLDRICIYTYVESIFVVLVKLHKWT